MDNLLQKTLNATTWIFASDQSGNMSVGIKQTGKFQHSSFLAGGLVKNAENHPNIQPADKPQDIVILETIDEAKEASGSKYGNANDEAPYDEWESEDDLDDNSSTAPEIRQQSETQGQKTQSKHSRALKLRDSTDRVSI
ncbi:hypothetical protein PtA15_5A858 [Puccinia triticina]|uniref:Uncharacterized protein n=1 Tax=Puccinia triticina TaxID=208348 RepID=A0ABY7CJ85_9BASI|nr:uncharacterized protein PtA15_5A858 [Puccinia triticina]WAQ85283.1 hypothetical protein PtA15_5A858 [Puccinia triticina]